MLKYFQTQWNQLKSTVRARWAKLTDENRASVAGNKDKRVGKVRDRYGFAQSEAARQVDNVAVKQAPVEQPAGKKTRPKKTAQPSAAAR